MNLFSFNKLIEQKIPEESRRVVIDGIPILIRKRSQSKNILIKIKPFDGVIVSIPHYTDFSSAELFINQKLDWIKKHLERMHEYQNKNGYKESEFPLITRNNKLDIHFYDGKKTFLKRSEALFLLRIPKNIPINSAYLQKKIKTALDIIYTKEAKEYLPQRLQQLSNQKKCEFNEVRIKRMRSRWGSCSSKNNINLSIYLMKLPDHLIDYVLLHELAHTRIKNHSRQFWNNFEELLPNCKTIDKELRKFNSTSKQIF